MKCSVKHFTIELEILSYKIISKLRGKSIYILKGGEYMPRRKEHFPLYMAHRNKKH